MKQKTFWEPLQGRNIDHLWRVNPFNSDFRDSACGMIYQSRLKRSDTLGDRRCLKCIKAVKQ